MAPVFAFPDEDAYYELAPKKPSYGVPKLQQGDLLAQITTAMAKTAIGTPTKRKEFQVFRERPMSFCESHRNNTRPNVMAEFIEMQAKIRQVLEKNRGRSIKHGNRLGSVLLQDVRIWNELMEAFSIGCTPNAHNNLSLDLSLARKRIQQYAEAERYETYKARMAQAAEEKKTEPKKQSVRPEEQLPGPVSREAVLQNEGDYERQSAHKKILVAREASKTLLESAQRIVDSKDGKLKAVKLRFRMEINRRVGQICSTKLQVFHVIRDMLKIFNEAWTEFGTEMMHYCIYLVAQKVINQAETQISIHVPSAYPIAQVCIDLGGHQPAFLPTLLTLMFQKCIYTVPRYARKREGEGDDKYKEEMGYIVSEGQVEEEQQYRDRMCGIVSLYAAIVQGRPLRKCLMNPHGLDNGWTWLASILNMVPRPITPLLICSFLEVAGYELSAKFGKNFVNILVYLRDIYIPRLPTECIAAKTRLELYLKDAKERQFKFGPPEGSVLE